MKILITGGGGFLGYRLAKSILARGTLADADGKQAAVTQIVLVDTAFPAQTDPRLKCVKGDFTDAALLADAMGGDTGSVFHLAAVVSGGVVSWFASPRPDGLEWSVAQASEGALATPTDPLHRWAAAAQRRWAALPGYDFLPAAVAAGPAEAGAFATDAGAVRPGPTWPAVNVGTSVAGLLGVALTLAALALFGWALGRRRR